MGKRGPKPKPTGLRILEGNPSRRPINHTEPRPTGEPVCPPHLCDDAQATWAQIMDSLPPGMIASADAPLLAAYCEACATHKQATERLNKRREINDLVYRGKVTPWIKIVADQARVMAMLSTRLGLSPADRSGLKLGDQGKESGRWGGLIA